MSVRKIGAVFQKQVKDTFKNKEVLLQFVLFPVIAFIMETTVKIPDLPDNYFLILFATMFIGMAPLTSMAAIIAEEKEKNTLRVLMMSNVKPYEYMIGVGGYILCICLVATFVFAGVGGYQGAALAQFILVMLVGNFTSMLIGAAIGTFSKSQMNATSITVPVMMILAFTPMIAMFNESISKFSRLFYSQQISNLIHSVGDIVLNKENIVVICLNVAIAVGLFAFAYQKCGLESS